MLGLRMRVGFILADGPVFESLLNYKRFSDLAPSTFIQRALDAFVTIGRYQTYLHRSSQTFRKRRDAMLKAIKHYMPAKISFDVPNGGLFIWLRLPDFISADKLLSFACKEGVAFVPGKFFFTDNIGTGEWMRLNFASQSVEDIEEGIRRLGIAIRKMKTST